MFMKMSKNIQSGALFLALAAMMLHWFIPHHEHMHHSERYMHIINILSEGATNDILEHEDVCHRTHHHKHDHNHAHEGHTDDIIQSCHGSFWYVLVQGLQLTAAHFQLIQPLWNFLLDLGIGLAPPSTQLFPGPYEDYDRENTVYTISYSVIYLVKSLGLRAPNGRLSVSIL